MPGGEDCAGEPTVPVWGPAQGGGPPPADADGAPAGEELIRSPLLVAALAGGGFAADGFEGLDRGRSAAGPLPLPLPGPASLAPLDGEGPAFEAGWSVGVVATFVVGWEAIGAGATAAGCGLAPTGSRVWGDGRPATLGAVAPASRGALRAVVGPAPSELRDWARPAGELDVGPRADRRTPTAPLAAAGRAGSDLSSADGNAGSGRSPTAGTPSWSVRATSARPTAALAPIAANPALRARSNIPSPKRLGTASRRCRRARFGDTTIFFGGSRPASQADTPKTKYRLVDPSRERSSPGRDPG